MKKFLLSSLAIAATFSLMAKVQTVDLPKVEPVELQPYATFDFAEIDESSGFVKSRQWDDLYWTLNDSGAENKIYPVTRDGKIKRAEWYKEDTGGIYVNDAVNVDWEEIATDSEGNLYIGAFGNNRNMRKDLAVYIVPEPFPLYTGQTCYFQRIDFYYPEQKEFPPEVIKFDCEAMFHANGKLYILTKHWNDPYTELYRFDSMDPMKKNPVTLVGAFESGPYVTAADATEDGSKMAMLTYNNIWLFEKKNEKSDDYFSGKISWLPIKLPEGKNQAEAICFDGDNLIITTEQQLLIEVPLKDLIEVR